jgi:hypothetical protein
VSSSSICRFMIDPDKVGIVDFPPNFKLYTRYTLGNMRLIYYPYHVITHWFSVILELTSYHDCFTAVCLLNFVSLLVREKRLAEKVLFFS